MRVWRWLLSGVLGGVLALAETARAQAAPVLLQIRPRPGDTLRVRLDQTVDITGTVRGAGGTESTASSETSTLVVLTKLYVENADMRGVTILAQTDSVRVTSPPNTAAGSMLAWARAAQGQRFRFHVASDGSTSAVGSHGWGKTQAGSILSQMPATLPSKPIVPGSTWSSVMEVPLGGATDTRGIGMITAIFRFDSLSRSGELAFISVRGRLNRTPAPAAKGEKEPVATIVESSGTVAGYVLVDRRRGWITEARTTMRVQSLIVPAAKERPPMRVQMTISQWMRVM